MTTKSKPMTTRSRTMMVMMKVLRGQSAVESSDVSDSIVIDIFKTEKTGA
jgi:hypothetical protein